MTTRPHVTSIRWTHDDPPSPSHLEAPRAVLGLADWFSDVPLATSPAAVQAPDWAGSVPQKTSPANAMVDLVFSMLLDREDNLVAEAEAGIPRQDELDVVRALLRLILSPNVRMPLSRLQ
jgi:hypothetical protein